MSIKTCKESANNSASTSSLMAQAEQSMLINDKRARYYQLPAQDPAAPIVHFYGGNGFAAGVYQPLLSLLTEQFHVVSLAMRGYWYDLPTAKKLSREDDAKMLIQFLEQRCERPVIGVGHSQGATATAIAAAMRPDLFSQLYLLEPVTFTKTQKLVYDLLPRQLKMSREPFKSTLTKQSHWESVEDYYQYLRAHRAFKRIGDEHLFIFANNSLAADSKGGYCLLFSPEQELANYFGTPYINGALKSLNKLKLPYTLIVGKPTIFISEKVRKSWRGIVPNERIITLPDYGHLLPMEAPAECAQIIIQQYLQHLANTSH